MRIKKRPYKNFRINTKDSSGSYGRCKTCDSLLFSMEYIYNHGYCNKCLKPQKDE